MLPLFPSAYIDDSLLTAVFAGVLLLWWLAERVGWPATGLVVPGYLGAILAIRPDAAAAVAVEAVVTALIADWVGRRLPRYVPVDIVFGRDRFFLIILVSVAVRLAVEVAPGPTLLEALGVQRVDGWHSIGLVLVPLAANALWKPGVFKGVPLVGLPVLAVFALLRFVLLPYTNLSLVTLELTYADLEWSFLGAPRVYLLLLVGAFIASHATIRFGWDFGGIIVCGLLAIAWLDPTKVGATFLEAAVIVLIVRGLSAVPPLRTANLSGLRPIVLAFAVSYAVKLALAAAGQGLWPTFRTSDLFGFGYLLPALLATRAFRAGQLTRILVPTALVSFGGFVGGTVLGVGLAALRGDATVVGEEAGDRLGPARIAVVEALGPDGAVGGLLVDELRAALARNREGLGFVGDTVRVDVYADGSVLSTAAGASGAVWWRPGGRRDVEIWVDGATAAGLAEAAVALGERLDARLVALDGDALYRSVHVRGAAPVRVALADTSGFAGPADLAPAVADIAPRIGDGDPPTVHLSPDAVRRLALEALADLPTADPQVADGRTLLAYQRGIVDPMLGGWTEVAEAWGRRMGVAVRPREILPLAAGATSVEVHLEDSPSTVIVEVRDPEESMIAVGRAWAERTSARAWLVVHDDRATDVSRVWLRALAARGDGVQVLSLDRLHRDDVVGGDAVIWDGRAASPVHAPLPVAELAVSLVGGDGFLPVLADASVARARFNDGGDHRREAVAPFGGSVATVWLGDAVRRAHVGMTPGGAHRLALSSAGIPIREADLAQLAGGAPVRDASFDALWAVLARYATTGHPGTLARLVDEAGGDVWAFSHESGRAMIVVERGDRVGVAPLGYSGRVVRVGEVTLPAVWRRR